MPWLFPQIIIAVSTAVAFASICSGPKPESFRAVQNSNYTYFGTDQEKTSVEIMQQGQDSWSVTFEGSDHSDVIRIGSQAWEGRGGSWTEVDPEEVKIIPELLIGPIKILSKSSLAKITGDGPVTGGERTSRLHVLQSAYGDAIIQEIDTRLSGAPDMLKETYNMRKERYKDASAEWEILVGKKTGRVYQSVLRIRGPNITGDETTSFEYSIKVKIEPPN